MKVMVHVKMARVTSIYHSYFIYNIFLERQFPGEYCLKVRHVFFKIFFIHVYQIKCFCFGFFNLYVFIFFFYVESMSVMSLWSLSSSEYREAMFSS